MKTTQLLVAFGLLLQFSWAVVVVVGEGTDAAGSPAPKDTNLSEGDLKEIIEEYVLDGKNELFQYLIVGDASEVESCGHSQGGYWCWTRLVVRVCACMCVSVCVCACVCVHVCVYII